MKKIIFILSFVFAIFLIGFILAGNASSSSYNVESFSTGISGGNASSATYSLITSILNQPASIFSTSSYKGTTNWLTNFGTPLLKITRPLNGFYFSGTDIKVNYTTSLTSPDYVWYNLDGGSNITLTGGTTFNTTDGNHTIYVFANNTFGLISKNVTFNVTTPPPVLNLSNATTSVNLPSTTPNLSIIVPTGVSSPKVSVEDSIVSASTGNNATISGTLTISASTTTAIINVSLPAGVKISGPANWTGEIILPTPKNTSSVNVTAGAGNQTSVSSVTEVGLENEALNFNKSVRILITGEGSKLAGYSRADEFTKITNVCSADTQEVGDALDEGSDCKIAVGSDMVVWTKHFTKFVTYTETVISSGSDSSDSSGSSGSGGGGGGGGATETPTPVKKADFTVEPTVINVMIKKGGVFKETIKIGNTEGSRQNFKIELVGIGDFVIIPETKFSLNPGETKEISVIFAAPDDAKEDTYVGNLKITSQKGELIIPVIIGIKSKISLFDITLSIPPRYKDLKTGEDLLLQISLFNLGEIGKVDVEITYAIKDLYGNIILQDHGTVAVETQASFSRSIKLPNTMADGQYVAIANVKYGVSVGTASDVFYINKGTLIPASPVLIILVVLGILAFLFFIVSRYLNKKVKEISKGYSGVLKHINRKIGVGSVKASEAVKMNQKLTSQLSLLDQAHEKGYISKEAHEKGKEKISKLRNKIKKKYL